MNLLTGFLKIR